MEIIKRERREIKNEKVLRRWKKGERDEQEKKRKRRKKEI